MKPTWMSVLMTALLLAAGPVADLTAQDSGAGNTAAAAAADEAAMTRWPAPVDEGNPYARPLMEARDRVQASIKKFYDDYYRDPWNFYLHVNNYYAYLDAYTRYRSILRKYWTWEREQRSFSGEVVSSLFPLPYPVPIPLMAGEKPADDGPAAGQPAGGKPDIMPPPRRFRPVPGASVVLERQIFFIRPAGVAAGTSAGDGGTAGTTATGDARPIIAPPPDWRPPTWRTVTDDRGRFAFRGLPTGNFTYRVSKKGFETETGVVELGNGSVKRRIVLRTAPSLAGRVMTVTPEAMPIILPLLRQEQGGAPADASADIEKVLADSALPPDQRRLRPLAGVTLVMQRSDIAVIMAREGSPATDSAVPGSPADAGTGDTGDAGSAPASVAGGADPAVRPLIWPGPQIPRFTATSNRSGRYQFERLATGEYRLTIDHPGYVRFSAPVTLRGGKVTRNVILVPLLQPPGPIPVPVPLAGTGEQVAPATGASLDNPFDAGN